MKEILTSFEYLPRLSLFWIKMEAKDIRFFNDYVNLITQPLTKGMFVPCDEEGNVLEEPERNNYLSVRAFTENLKQYQQAKDRVIFEGWESNGSNNYQLLSSTGDYLDTKRHKTIEDAINAGVKLKYK